MGDGGAVVRECHNKQTRHLLTVYNRLGQLTSLQADWLLKQVMRLTPATGDLTSWITGDIISWFESSWNEQINITATFFCNVVQLLGLNANLRSELGLDLATCFWEFPPGILVSLSPSGPFQLLFSVYIVAYCFLIVHVSWLFYSCLWMAYSSDPECLFPLWDKEYIERRQA